ncbi:MAG: acetyl-CoA carboxylase biotin carboxyl carrier protein subunit [Minisyncoccales bacterium]
MKKRIKLGDQTYEIEMVKIKENLLRIVVNEKEFYFSLNPDEKEPNLLQKEEVEKLLFSFVPSLFAKEKKIQEKTLKSPLAGKVSEVFVKEGDYVKINQRLLTIISMKMENEILSDGEGKIKEIKIKKGDIVAKDDLLIVFE